MSEAENNSFRKSRVMRRGVLALLCAVLSMLSGCTDGDKEGEERAASEDVARRRALQIQELFNLNPGPEILPRLELIADSMRRDGRHTYYFAALNVIIDRLFSEGSYMKADSLAVRMNDEAMEMRDSLSIAIAKRVRAQMLYKLSQPERALEQLESAEPYLIDPFRSGKEFATASNIREWLWIVSRALGDTARMNREGIAYAELVDRNTEINKWSDPTMHSQVTALSFRGRAAMAEGRYPCAKELLDSAASLMLPSLPARAYEHLYEVRSELRAAEGDWAGALEDIDTLLNTHRHYPWFYIEDILLKAQVLNLAGRHQESADAYSRYVAFHDSLSNSITGKRLNELTTLYRTEIDEEHRATWRTRLVAACVVILLLLVLLVIMFRHSSKVRKRNRFLVERLHELDKANESLVPDVAEEDESRLSAIERLDRYMTTEKPYINASLGRKELAEATGLSQDAVMTVIRSERNCSVHSYINSFRLEEARRILDTDPRRTIADIAGATGFGTARTLQRGFKERYDMTPAQYRDAASGLK